MSESLLTVERLNAYYGHAHVLQEVSFSITEQAVAIVGRNGMGKSTLCAAIMGMTPPRTNGSIRFQGKELVGRPSHKVAGLVLSATGTYFTTWYNLDVGPFWIIAPGIVQGLGMGMIFVPSVGGISHSPRELTKWEDCARGADVLLHTVLTQSV